MNTKIEDILEHCIAEVRMGKTPEETLRQYPDVADDIRPMLTLACELQKLPGPSTSVSGLIRTMAKLSVQQTGTKATAQRRKITLFSRPVLIRAAAVTLIVFVAGWTTVASSAQALPGDLLYPIKLFSERVRFCLAINQESKAELCIVFAEERVKELVKRHSKGGGLNKKLLAAMLNEAKMALDAGPELPEVSRDLLNSRVASLSQFQKHTLEQLEKRVSPEEKQDLKAYLDICCLRCCWMQQRMGGSEPDSAQQQSEQRRGCWDMCPR